MRPRKRSLWLDRLGWLAIGLLLGGLIAAWLRLVPAMPAFQAFAIGGLLSIPLFAAFVVSRIRGYPFGAAGWAISVAAILFAARLITLPDVPSINDFTTDPQQPPEFRHARTLPANLGRDLSWPAEFTQLQAECCADLAPLHTNDPPAAAWARALATARAMDGWEIVSAAGPQGPIEAVSVSYVFGFRDDVVIRIRPEGDGSIIDIRSKSRDGRGDLGANAERIRAWQRAFEAD